MPAVLSSSGTAREDKTFAAQTTTSTPLGGNAQASRHQHKFKGRRIGFELSQSQILPHRLPKPTGPQMQRGLRLMLCAFAVCLTAVPVFAAGDFPVASCQSWNGTVVEREGIDSRKALMVGIVTKADLQEYCERVFGDGTGSAQDKTRIRKCVADSYRDERRIRLVAKADCEKGTLQFRDGTNPPQAAKFPLNADADNSCGSGMPPLIDQFKMLCPTASSSMNME